MRISPNTKLWRFIDAIVPDAWKSKQAKRIYEAAMEAEQDHSWSSHAAIGSVRTASNRDSVPKLDEPRFGHNRSDVYIERSMRRHVADLRAQADHLEKVMRAYGPQTFRKRRVSQPAPVHPFDAEKAILDVISSPDADELWVNGRHFVRDSSRAFVRATETEKA